MRRVVAVAATFLLAAEPAPAVDLHDLWDQSCADCHGHAGDFARRHLRIEDGVLRGRHWQDLKAFLRNHYPPEGAVDDLYAMLLAQAGTEGRFKERCAGCHGSAAALARKGLEFRGDVLYGTGTGRPVAEFLPGHTGLSREDARFFAALLERVERETAEPPKTRGQ